MNEETLRALVRDTIARVSSREDRSVMSEAGTVGAPARLHPHPSSYQYALPPSDGPCIIEPGVPCNHCGYCQTHGH